MYDQLTDLLTIGLFLLLGATVTVIGSFVVADLVKLIITIRTNREQKEIKEAKEGRG